MLCQLNLNIRKPNLRCWKSMKKLLYCAVLYHFTIPFWIFGLASTSKWYWTFLDGAGSVGRCGRSADSRDPESSEIGGCVYVVDFGTLNLGIRDVFFQSSKDHGKGSFPVYCHSLSCDWGQNGMLVFDGIRIYLHDMLKQIHDLEAMCIVVWLLNPKKQYSKIVLVLQHQQRHVMMFLRFVYAQHTIEKH